MAKQKLNSVKLGAFVLAGLVFLVLLLYMIGKNEHLFGNTFLLKARFDNIQGLVAGNNVRYAGIATGTVNEISILNDTTIEVSMMIDKKMFSIIKKNAVVSVGTEGFVGNKVVNITPVREPATVAGEGDILFSKKSASTDDMLLTLSKTTDDIAVVAAELKQTIRRINNSSTLWDLLNDGSIPKQIKASLVNIKLASANAGTITDDLGRIVADIKLGKGSAGLLLRDSAFSVNLNAAVLTIKSVGEQADSLVAGLNETTRAISNEWQHGKGMATAFFKDSVIVQKINTSLDNIQKGTDGFNQNMEALKHNFLFRGYFKKLEKQKKKTGCDTAIKIQNNN